jgi:hypothetical protein
MPAGEISLTISIKMLFYVLERNAMNPSSNMRQNAHAVIIGIDKYQDQKIPKLTFARADAEGVYQILTDPELGRIPPDNVILLLDEDATQRNIRSAIGTKIPKRAGEQDMIYVYRQAKELHGQAQSLYDAGKFDEAYELWQRVINLVPDHDGAKRGTAEIENRLEEVNRQEIVKYRQSILLNLYHEGRFPSDEFERGMKLLEKKQNELTAMESKTRKLLDDLADGRISVAIYLSSVRLLRMPAVPEVKKAIPKSEPDKGEATVVPKIEPKKYRKRSKR